MTPWEGLNRRKFPRVTYPCLVVIRHEEEKQDRILTHTENVGIGGICIVLKKGLKMFSPVEVELDLLDVSTHIKCKGKVVWCVRRASEEPGKPNFHDIGIEFEDITDTDRSRLQDIVTRIVKYGKKPSRA